jgi:YbbR domain-containing protein
MDNFRILLIFSVIFAAMLFVGIHSLQNGQCANTCWSHNKYAVCGTTENPVSYQLATRP